jgi:predicted nuclease of predicted toxin-antitoxin system
MKILLDESLPIKLAALIVGHELHTMRSMHWLGRKNGLLLMSMRDEKFEVLITADTNLRYQRNLKKYPIALIVLHTDV